MINDTSTKSDNIKTVLKLKPCDCKDMYTANKLNDQGIKYNEDSISLQPNLVLLKIGHTAITIPMKRFQQFAEWFLTEQIIEI